MFRDINLRHLCTGEELLTEHTDTAPNAQISQDALQGVAYRLRDLPTSAELLTEHTDTAPNAQISQEALQGAAYRLQTSD